MTLITRGKFDSCRLNIGDTKLEGKEPTFTVTIPTGESPVSAQVESDGKSRGVDYLVFERE